VPNININLPYEINELRQLAEIKRGILQKIFFNNEHEGNTPFIFLEYSKAGEIMAPMVSEWERGKAYPRKQYFSKEVEGCVIGPKFTFTASDLFRRLPPQGFGAPGFSANRVFTETFAEELKRQEEYIVNKIDYMIAQFLTTGIVSNVAGDVTYELDYELPNISTLPAPDRWDQTGVDALASFREIIKGFETTNNIKASNIIVGSEAAEKLINNENYEHNFSIDLQSRFALDTVRETPGLYYIGRDRVHQIDVYAFERTATTFDGTNLQLIPGNVVIGGPSGGTVKYGPIVDFREAAPAKSVKRYASTTVDREGRTLDLSTESRVALQPMDISAYFCVTVL